MIRVAHATVFIQMNIIMVKKRDMRCSTRMNSGLRSAELDLEIPSRY